MVSRPGFLLLPSPFPRSFRPFPLLGLHLSRARPSAAGEETGVSHHRAHSICVARHHAGTFVGRPSSLRCGACDAVPSMQRPSPLVRDARHTHIQTRSPPTLHSDLCPAFSPSRFPNQAPDDGKEHDAPARSIWGPSIGMHPLPTWRAVRGLVWLTTPSHRMTCIPKRARRRAPSRFPFLDCAGNDSVVYNRTRASRRPGEARQRAGSYHPYIFSWR